MMVVWNKCRFTYMYKTDVLIKMCCKKNIMKFKPYCVALLHKEKKYIGLPLGVGGAFFAFSSE